MSAASTTILLRAMGLTTAARLQVELTTRAESENWGYTRFLHRLLEEEGNERLRRRIERLRKQSGLPASKTLGAIDEARLPEKVRIASELLLPKRGCCLIINVTDGNDFRRTNKMEVIHECFDDGAGAPGTGGGVAAAIRGSNSGREGQYPHGVYLGEWAAS